MVMAQTNSKEIIARDYAISVLASLSEKKLLEFLAMFADENTLARMESDMLAYDPNAKSYDIISDRLNVILLTVSFCSDMFAFRRH